MKLPFALRSTAVVGAFLLGLSATHHAHAATFNVTNGNDSGAGSLRQAILDANKAPSDDSIVFEGNSPRTINLSSGELKIAARGSLSISGRASFAPFFLDGNKGSRIFNIAPGARVSLTYLVFNDGYAQGQGQLANGGAIFNSGDLTMTQCGLFGNTVAPGGSGGTIYNNGGRLRIFSSSFATSSAYSLATSGGSIGGSGGFICNTNGGSLTIDKASFSGGRAASGGAISNGRGCTLNLSHCFMGDLIARINEMTPDGLGGGVANSGTVTMNDSRLSSCVGGQGGAFYNSSGAKAIISNSTLDGNEATTNGGAISNNTGGLEPGSVSLESCTLVLNKSDLGGGIFNADRGDLKLNNSIVARNGNSGSIGPNIYGAVAQGDYNLVDDTTGTILPGNHNIVGRDPKLASGITGIGGSQEYLTGGYIPTAGSPAIDAGKSALSFDQFGQARPVDVAGVVNAGGGNGSDIGAIEVNELPQSGSNLVVNKTDDGNDGVCGVTDCTLREALNRANQFAESTITFSPRVFASRQTVTLRGESPYIYGDHKVSIIGPTGQNAGVNLNNNTNGPLLYVMNGTATVSNIWFTGGGTGIVSYDSSTLTVNSCTFSGMKAGIENGLFQDETSTLVVNNSTFWANREAGIVNSQYDSAGVTAHIDSCTFSKNGIGIDIEHGTVNVSNSLIVGNSLNIKNGQGTLKNKGHNIATGTAAQAGLDSFGLNINGGPTPTIALVAGSRAIDAGSTSQTTDQRGAMRDGKPDIGAFENNAPSVVSVSPQNASDKVGAKRTFSLTVSDANGVSDIAGVWLVLNERVGWNADTLLFYQPSAASPLRGKLFLSKDGITLPPLEIGVGSRAVLDNGSIAISARDVAVSVSGNSFTLTLPLTIRDGLVGQNHVFARVVDAARATDPAATVSDMGFRRFGTYTVTPQFSDLPSSAPTLSKLSPGGTNTVLSSAGLGPIQNFSFTAADANGIGDLESVWFLAGKTLSWANSATFVYQPRSRRLYLRSDDGNSFLGGAPVGTAGFLENSQVRLDLSKVRVITNGDGKTVGLVLPLQAKRGLLGQNKVWLRAQDNQGATAPNGDAQGYVLSGVWNVTQTTASSSANALSAGHS